MLISHGFWADLLNLLEQDVILRYVRWYPAYPLSYRQLEELMQEHGVSVDHSTINRRVVKDSDGSQFLRRMGQGLLGAKVGGEGVERLGWGEALRGSRLPTNWPVSTACVPRRRASGSAGCWKLRVWSSAVMADAPPSATATAGRSLRANRGSRGTAVMRSTARC